MFRRITLALWLAVAGCSVVPEPYVPFASAAPTANVADLVSKTVALVDVENVGSIRPYCSGVWVSDTTILTANHCVADMKYGELNNYVVQSDVYAPGELAERDQILARNAVLYAVDKEHDLALLSALTPPKHGIARLTVEPVRAGQRVTAMGAPLGEMWSYSSGDVAAVRYLTSHGYKILFIQATTPISGGNSGGGLFNEMGELVGVCHATFTNGQNMNLWVHWQYAADLLKLKMVQ